MKKALSTNSSLRSCYANKYMGAVCRHLQKRGDKHEKGRYREATSPLKQQ